jgi:hypothetical protein
MHLGLTGDLRLRQRREIGERDGTIPEIPNRNLSNHKRVDSGEPLVEQLNQCRLR